MELYLTHNYMVIDSRTIGETELKEIRKACNKYKIKSVKNLVAVYFKGEPQDVFNFFLYLLTCYDNIKVNRV